MPENYKEQVNHTARASETSVAASQDTPVFSSSPDPGVQEQDTPYQLACDIHAFVEDLDTYGYWDAVYVHDMDRAIQDDAHAIADGAACDSHMKYLAAIIRNFADDPDMAENVAYAKSLLNRLGAYVDSYSIYQLKNGLETREYRFEAFDHLKEQGLAVNPEHYTLVYKAHLSPDASLDSIYETFNIHRPSDFHGHSLSISDVIVFQRAGEGKAHYVDRFGFREIPGFLERERRPSLASAEAEHQHNDKTETLSERKSEKPSIYAQLPEAKKVPAQIQDRKKAALKYESKREV